MSLKTHLKVNSAIALFIGAVVLGVEALPVFLTALAVITAVLIYGWLYAIFSD